MKNSPLFSVSMLFCLFMFNACDKYLSNSIKNITPIEHSHFDAGSSLHIKATLKDKKGLASYRVRIGNKNGTSSTPFPWEESGEISGESYSFESTPQIPENIEGTFYIIFEITDVNGDRSERIHEFHVDN